MDAANGTKKTRLPEPARAGSVALGAGAHAGWLRAVPQAIIR